MGRKSDLSPKFPVSKLIVCSLGPHFYFDVHIGLPLNTHNVLIILISNTDTEAHADHYYAALLPRRGRIMRRTLSVRPSVRLSVCPSVCLSVRPVMERHVAPPSELQ